MVFKLFYCYYIILLKIKQQMKQGEKFYIIILERSNRLMISKNNLLNRLLVVVFLFTILQTGCSTAVKKPPLSSTEPETGLSEISGQNQFPDF